MVGYFEQFINQCSREQLMHFTICELDIYELMDLVGTKIEREVSEEEQERIVEKALSNLDDFKKQVTDNIIESINHVSNERLIHTLCQLPPNRQNTIMEDDYDWQLED